MVTVKPQTIKDIGKTIKNTAMVKARQKTANTKVSIKMEKLLIKKSCVKINEND